MVQPEDIRAYSRSIIRQYSPIAIWLFGSYSDGRATNESDVDMLVIMNTELHPAKQAACIRISTRPPFACDLIVRTPKQIRARMSEGDSFLSDIFSHGTLLYES
ncbi:MAG: nucleotidyltransferase domain-containing protein [Ignavibacteriae bacterium]|nr:nucleotidyltransferase domain-containing protein [Ignavibacteriota bacterium]